MDFQLFRVDMQSHLAEFVDHLPTMQLASIYKTSSLETGSGAAKPPNLLNFYPQSLEEVEIQRFNISGDIPHRFSSADHIMIWLLETESLIRQHVCNYLTSSTSNHDIINPRVVLEALSKKICSLDASEGFIEGLRVYLPICGGIIPSDTAVYTFISEDKKMNILLQAYVRAHILYSKSPIIDPKLMNDDVIHAITEIAQLVVNTYRSLSSSDKPISAMNHEFQVSFREILTKKLPTAPIDGKIIFDMFMMISSNDGHLVPLYIPEKISSYLYASIVKTGWIRLGFNTDTDVMMRSYVRLSYNALYIFVDDEAPTAQGIIPLQYLRPQLSDTLNTYSTIILVPVLDNIMPYIAMSSTIYKRDSIRWSAPDDVTYHLKFILDILDDDVHHMAMPRLDKKAISTPMVTSLPAHDASKESKLQFRKHVELVAQWLEALEECSWESRHSDDGQHEGC